MRHRQALSLAAGAALVLCALAALVLVGRHGTPERVEPLSAALASLRAPEYDPRFGLEYWTERLVYGEPEWGQGLAFCRDRSPEQYPNCRTIALLDTVGRVPGFPGPSPEAGSEQGEGARQGAHPDARAGVTP